MQADINEMQENRNAWFIPGAIIVAGVILAGSIYFVRSSHVLGLPDGDVTALRPLAANDHRIGNPTAPVVIVEYADIDSSYAKSFQATMEQIMAEYAPAGKVAWVYRHFPLVDQHLNSEQHAEAAECAGSLGNENSFWSFIDLVQSRAPANQQFSPDGYDDVVKTLGIDTAKFNACMTARTFRTRVSDDISNAITIGANGSPYSVVLIKGQKSIPPDGALPYDAMKKIIQQAIAKTE